MKRKIIIASIVFVLFFLLFRFGIQLGDFRIGDQKDLKTKQDINYKESSFYRKHFDKNNLLVLNLWATWCEPCIGEIPELNDIQNKFKNDSIDFLSLSVDNDSVKLIKFLDKDKFKYKDITLENLKYRNAILNILEGEKPENWIGSQSVPITYLVKNKKIVAKIDGTIEKEELINLIKKYK